MALSLLYPPFPDEHLYSVAARTRVLTTGNSARNFAREFSGSPSFQLDLGVGFVRAQKGLVKDPEPFLKTTVTGFLTSFLNPPVRRSELKQAIREGNRLRSDFLLGRAGARRLSLPFFRYCPACAVIQRSQSGQAYWTRMAQISGFTHCPAHKCRYVETSVRRHGHLPGETRDFVCLEDVIGKVEPGLVESGALVDLSGEGSQLFDYQPTWDTGRLNRAWWRLLRAAGLRRGGHGVTVEMCEMLAAKYGRTYLDWSGCGLGESQETSWITTFLRAPGKEPDPIRHLLLLGLFGKGIADLEEGTQVFLSHPLIDKNPALCLNRVCGCFGKPATKQTRIYAHRRTRKQMAQFICSGCDQIIERSLEPDDPVEYRIVERGELWENELRRLWGIRDLSVRKIGKRLGAESLTIKRHALSLGLPFPRIGVRVSRAVPAKAVKMQPAGSDVPHRDQKRQAWIDALKKEMTITKAKKAVRSVYFWLYRNDLIWLRASLPPRVKREAAASRVDWKHREDAFCTALQLARERLVNREPPILCSATALLREIGGYEFYSYLDKMPRLKAELAVLGEKRTAFAIRRLEVAKAGLGPGATPRAIFVEAKLKSDLWQCKEIRQYLGLSEENQAVKNY